MGSGHLPQRAFAKAVPGCQGKGQDAASVLTRNGVTALAVADGVTSAGSHAGLGARSAAAAATVFLTERFDEIVSAGEDRLRNYFFSYFRTYYLRELNAAAEAAGLPQVLQDAKAVFPHLRLYSTTIIACGVRDDRLVMMKIGNGLVAADAGAGFGVVSPSELARGQTPCIERLYDPGFEHFSFRRYLVPDLTCLVLMSDGVEHTSPLLYDGIDQQLTGNFLGWLQGAVQTEEAFSEAVEELGRTGEDDVAVAVLVRGEADLSPKSLLQGNPFAGCELYRLSAAPAAHRDADLSAAAPATPRKPADPAARPAIDVPGPGPEEAPPPKPASGTPRPSTDVSGPDPELEKARSVSSDGPVRLNATPKKRTRGRRPRRLSHICTLLSGLFRRGAANTEAGGAALAEDAAPSDEGVGPPEGVSPAAAARDQGSGPVRQKGARSRRSPWNGKLVLPAILLIAFAFFILALVRRLS